MGIPLPSICPVGIFVGHVCFLLGPIRFHARSVDVPLFLSRPAALHKVAQTSKNLTTPAPAQSVASVDFRAKDREIFWNNDRINN